MIEISHVSKTFHVKGKKVEAVKDVSLTIEQGDCYGIIGYSGAGKSTLIRMLNHLEKPDQGEVKIHGQSLNALKEADLLALRKKIGMIFQSFNLLSSATVYDNIAAPLKNHTGLNKKQIEQKVLELANLVGLEDKLKAYPNQLSGGQKQRVAIARALSNDPEILLCDEATSALDPNTTFQILQLIQQIQQKYHLTVVLITHQMEVVKAICNKVAIMDQGEICEAGKLVDIFIQQSSKIGKEFIDQSKHMSDVLQKQQELKTDFIRLTFVGDCADEPLIATALKKFDVYVSILFGNIEKLGDVPYGSLIVTLSGEKKEECLAYFKEQGIVVEVLPYESRN